MTFVAIVPFRNDSAGIRRANAEAVLNWLSGLGISVLLSEHSAQPDSELIVPDGVRRIHTPSSEAFNKAQACNAGFKNTTEDAIALVDADTVMNSRVFIAALKRVAAKDEVIRPFGSLTDLTVTETEKYLTTQELPVSADTQRDDRRSGDVIPMCGGIVILTRERYFSVGGFDERFRGWGGEDDAFGYALARSGATIMIVKAEPAYHLWHDRNMIARATHPHYRNNVALSRWWHSAPAEELNKQIESAQLMLTPGWPARN
ncbi:galactosyltransferase-related protein [Aurantimicrobium minutum]|uniref:galactosyltransferase-related protein n=1 Tax=Aurantimicrobium minutum TaxID=708131 RepID=UPI00247442A3|nr:galactosyltransferase-related protein [Aurantimicrobium minutum]MDH6423397.1 glycosyltransferase involved in cell wall biosynthesis [Aurantimicrobium minutum]